MCGSAERCSGSVCRSRDSYTRATVDVATYIRVFLELFVTALFLVVVGRVLISWINPTFEGPVAHFLFETTEPLLSPIRRVLPPSGMVDLSPLVLVFVLGILLRLALFA